ncbi:MAG: M28 family peptidase, partial [Bacteroidota bacterium]
MKIPRQSLAFFLLIVLFHPLLVFGQALELPNEEALQDLKTLSSDSYQGRATGTEGGKMAQEYIKQRMEEIGLEPYRGEWYQTFTASDRDEQSLPAANVVGILPGRSSEAAIVISAHYDHLGVRGDDIYNGADDNASGTAAILAIASYFKEHTPEHTLIFAAFDAEEIGLQGSRHFVSQLPKDEEILFNLNFDMISRSAAKEIFAVGTYHLPALKPRMEHLVDKEKWGVLVRFGHDRPRSHRQDWTYASDHAPFFR